MRFKLKLLWLTFKANWQSLSGFFLFLFMCVHFFGVSLINFGICALNWYTKHLDKSNTLIVGAVFLVLVVAFFHMIGGCSIILDYLRHPKQTWRMIKDMNYTQMTLWGLNFFVAIPILMLGLITHIIVACITSGHDITTAAYIQEQFQSNMYWFTMAALLGGLVYHMMSGTRKIIITYNLWEKYQTKIFYGLVVFGIALFSLGLHNLFLLK